MKISLFAAIPISKQQTYIMTNFSLTHTNMRAKQHTVVYWLFLSLKLKQPSNERNCSAGLIIYLTVLSNHFSIPTIRSFWYSFQGSLSLIIHIYIYQTVSFRHLSSCCTNDINPRPHRIT